MGVALEYGTIHKCARVALVGVAADILLNVAAVARCKLPFKSGRESGASASAEPGIEHGLDNLVRGHLRKHFAERRIAVACYVFFDVFGINNAAVPERYTHLVLVECGLAERGRDFAALYRRIVVDQALNGTSLKQVLLDDFGDILGGHSGVENAFRIDYHNGTECTQTEAAGVYKLYFLGKFSFFKLRGERFPYGGTAGGGTAGTRAD